MEQRILDCIKLHVVIIILNEYSVNCPICFVFQIRSEQKSCEIDPSRLKDDEKLEENMVRF